VIQVVNKTKGTTVEARHDLTERQIEIMLLGGMLNYIKLKSGGKLEAREPVA
jgi:hypothetical protein